jgi:glycosyltransferase involved in cell wall biosynthesis
MTPIRVALVSRTVFPLHGYGGLERHVYDLARALVERGVQVTLITQPPSAGQTWTPESIDPSVRAVFVPYHTFPGAGRRGTTVLDRSTAYPLFGLRAGRRARDLVGRGEADIVHGLGASVLGYARARLRARNDAAGASARQAAAHRAASAPLVLNPQGLEEFGATDPSRAPFKRAAYLPLR